MAGRSFRKGDQLDFSKLPRWNFPLKEIGDDVFLMIRALSAPEIDTFLSTNEDGSEKFVSGYKLISIVALDENLQPMFESEEDCRANLKIGAPSMMELVKKIQSLSGIDAAKDRSKN